MKYHVHIYEVKNEYEIDLDEGNQSEARAKAIEIYNKRKDKLKKVSSDRDIIVLAFKQD